MASTIGFNFCFICTTVLCAEWNFMRQECIPVGSVPSVAVSVGGGVWGYLPMGGCGLPMGGICLWDEVYTPTEQND